jgi:hypothetical protein
LKKCIAHRAQHRLGILASKEKGAYLSRTNPSAHDRQLAFRKDDVELAQLEEYIFLWREMLVLGPSDGVETEDCLFDAEAGVDFRSGKRRDRLIEGADKGRNFS